VSFWAKLRQKKAPPSIEREVASLKPPAVSSPELNLPARKPQTGGIAHSLNAFGLRLLREEASRAPKENIFISPLSVFLALAMAEVGSGGETKSAMRRALGLPADANQEALNQAAVALMKKLRLAKSVDLTIANALWADVEATVAAEFVSVCQEVYEAAVQTIELSQPGAAIAINKWVAEKTRGNIRDIVTPGDIAAAPAVITNAVYFRGKFSIPFRKEATQAKPFHLANGSEKLVPMMRQKYLDGAYRQGKGFEAAVLNYEGSMIELYMLLPTAGVSPEDILKEETLPDLFVQDEYFVLDLTMPRFTLDFTCRLKSSLTQMGMGIAFEYPGADFAPLGSPLFFIGEVIHKTRLEVDEEGTVAAAATSMVMTLSAALPRIPEKRTLVFDRPFALLLRDRISGADLFAGVVYEPQTNWV
jgi:serine protease inhibitor